MAIELDVLNHVEQNTTTPTSVRPKIILTWNVHKRHILLQVAKIVSGHKNVFFFDPSWPNELEHGLTMMGAIPQ